MKNEIKVEYTRGVDNTVYLRFSEDRVDIVKYNKNPISSRHDFITYEMAFEVGDNK